MSRLNEILIDQYSRHYARASVTFDDPRWTGEALKNYETQFGEIVRRFPAGSEIADLGCGSGMMLSWLAAIPNLRPVGVDGSAGQIEIARRKLPSEVELQRMDLGDFLRDRPAKFSAIFALNILEHIPDDDGLLNLMERAREALVPGGIFICSVPNAASLIGGHMRYIDLTHFRSFTTLSLLQLLEAAGLQDCHIRPRKGTDFTQAVRMKIEHWMHRVVYRLCGQDERNFEKILIGVGYREGAKAEGR